MRMKAGTALLWKTYSDLSDLVKKLPKRRAFCVLYFFFLSRGMAPKAMITAKTIK